MAYNWLRERRASRASKEYLKILYLAARRNEAMVDYAIRNLIDNDQPISIEAVTSVVDSIDQVPSPVEVTIEKVDLCMYDALLHSGEEVQTCYPMN
jgi:hypothetical protein